MSKKEKNILKSIGMLILMSVGTMASINNIMFNSLFGKSVVIQVVLLVICLYGVFAISCEIYHTVIIEED